MSTKGLDTSTHFDHPSARPGGATDVHGTFHHKETLRLALGAILAPKRPTLSRGSSTTSGTASPANIGYHLAGHSSPHPPPPTPQFTTHDSHPPSNLKLQVGMPITEGNEYSSHPTSTEASHVNNRSVSEPVPTIHAPTSQATSTSGSPTASGTGTPRAHFVETLQSKHKWDALIHGSFA